MDPKSKLRDSTVWARMKSVPCSTSYKFFFLLITDDAAVSIHLETMFMVFIIFLEREGGLTPSYLSQHAPHSVVYCKSIKHAPQLSHKTISYCSITICYRDHISLSEEHNLSQDVLALCAHILKAAQYCHWLIQVHDVQHRKILIPQLITQNGNLPL